MEGRYSKRDKYHISSRKRQENYEVGACDQERETIWAEA